MKWTSRVFSPTGGIFVFSNVFAPFNHVTRSSHNIYIFLFINKKTNLNILTNLKMLNFCYKSYLSITKNKEIKNLDEAF